MSRLYRVRVMLSAGGFVLLTSALFVSVDGVMAPTTSTQVFYISVSVCCIVIFLVAIFLAIMHFHSMRRVEVAERCVSAVLLLMVPSKPDLRLSLCF